VILEEGLNNSSPRDYVWYVDIQSYFVGVVFGMLSGYCVGRLLALYR
jgi:hypothetical protein